MESCSLLHALTRRRILAIVRGPDPAAAEEAVLTLARAGIDLVEVSLTGADALGVLERCVARLGPTVHLGAGTVLTAADVRRVSDAGAAFVVTPATTPAVGECVGRGIPVLAGAFTPTEVAAAHAGGATAVKLFPAAQLGPAYLRALRDPFPDVRFVPVGGIDVDAAPAYLAAGAIAVGVGSPLLGAAVRGDRSGFSERIARFRALAGTPT